MSRVKLLCGGKSFNGQTVEEDKWENVGPFEMAKVVGDFFLWSWEGLVDTYEWCIETRNGTEVAVGTYTPREKGSTLDDVWKHLEEAQKLADAALETVITENNGRFIFSAGD